MSYLVTARKWRPKKFSEVKGQEHITRTLRNTIKNGRIAHSYIFAGPRGVGKTTTARIMAKTLNCLNIQDGEPCNECEMCESFNKAQSMDIIEIDGASNRRIEEIRNLRESVKYAPTRGKYKVYIIDEVHMLTTESFNALLKTLEEPPEHTIFIFATTDIHKVPLTIISRCQRYDFKRISITDIKEQLQWIADNEGIKIDDKSLTLVAKRADGALRDAQSLFDQVTSFSGEEVTSEILAELFNIIDEDIYFELSDAIIEKDFSAAFTITQKLFDNGWNFLDFLNGLTEHFRNIMTTVIRKDAELIEWADIYKKRYVAYKDSFSEGDMLRLINFINKASYELKNASNEKLKMEIALSHIIGLERSETISSLLEQVQNGNIPAAPSDGESSKKKALNLTKPPVQQEKKPEEPPKEPEPPVVREKAPPKPQPSPAPPAEEKQEKEVPASENETPAAVSFDKIKLAWKDFINDVSDSIPMAGGLLVGSQPLALENGKIKATVTNPTDGDTLENFYSRQLSEKAMKHFGKELLFKFVYDKEADESAGTETYEETPLVKAVMEELGAKRMN